MAKRKVPVKLVHARAHELFHYSVITGRLYNKIDRGRRGEYKAGNLVSCSRLFHKNGRQKYAQLEVDGEKWYQHRLIWFWVTGELPITVDHENLDICDNTWLNLRDATVSQNGWNRNKQKNNTSGYKGVHFRKDKGTYVANVRANGKVYRLGSFIDAETAYEAYKTKAAELHGEFLRHDEN